MRVTATPSDGIRPRLAAALDEAARALGVAEVPDLELGRARNPSHGDYASSAAMKLARELRQAPPQIAVRLAETINVPDQAADAIAEGGYVNFKLTPRWLQGLIASIAATGEGYAAFEGAKGAVETTQQLDIVTLRLHRNLGLAGRAAAQWAAIAQSRGVKADALHYDQDPGPGYRSKCSSRRSRRFAQPTRLPR